jgi:hypothetical protein
MVAAHARSVYSDDMNTTDGAALGMSFPAREWGVTSAAVPARLIAAPRVGAAEALRDFEQGGRFVGITKGQFSLVDILRALLDKTGPADVTICAWTSGIRDVESAAWLLRTGRIQRLRWFIDRSFVTRQPKYASEVRRLFGDDSLVESNTHAKLLLISNDDWKVTVRSSMNLNCNRRLEQFDVDDSADIHEFFSAMLDEIAEKMGPGLRKPCETVDAVFDQVEFAWAPSAPPAEWRPREGPTEWVPDR